ncbi:hypothetical protein BDN72DRAFT_965275 [Pluteus cervinus]|uniref:Uncharacterized protein n=1 Tax=Pluteus cervinus TaxID=181527 RepID=A0ACD3A6K5_9AGAR|nr:hypothetical protein BDN72DRAFT_965275 [Pluteus cervinus]
MNTLNKYMINRDDAPEGLTPILPNWLKPFKPSEVRLPPIANLFNELGIARPRAPEVPSDNQYAARQAQEPIQGPVFQSMTEDGRLAPQLEDTRGSTPISDAMAPFRPHGLDRPINRQSRLCGRPLKWHPTGYLRLQLDIDQHNGCQPHAKATESRFIAYSAIGGLRSTDKAEYEAFRTKGVDEAEDNEKKSTRRLVDIVYDGKGVRSDGRNNQPKFPLPMGHKTQP